MKLLPYENFYLTTKLTSAEVISNLKNNIIPRGGDIFRANSSTTRAYEGFISKNKFEVSRIIRYRNSFLPTIQGEIYDQGTGSRIHIKMKLHPAVLILLIVWMSGVTVGFFALIATMINTRKFEPAIFAVLFMYAFGYGLSVGAFKFESSKSKKFFAELLNAAFENKPSGLSN